MGTELSLAYKQRLLVVMPNGFGVSWPQHSTASTYRLLTKVPIAPGTVGLLDAATTAVRRLAAAAGINVAPATRPSTAVTAAPRAAGNDRGAIITAVAAVAGLIALALLVSRRRRRDRPVVGNQLRAAHRSASSIRLRWAIPGVALVLGIAVAAPIVAVRIFRHPGTSGTPASQIVTPPPVSWPAGRRPAPNFVLSDQRGRRVSLAAYRGRPVIVTFIDPLCRNLCPLAAKVLSSAVDGLPARQRPVVLAVSVDVYAHANARSNLMRDVGKWQLVPQWQWAVGRARQLSAIWKRYEIEVSVITKKIAGTTIHYITHTEGAYVIDATGHERALFLWPFYPQDVEHVLRRLT